MPAAALAPAQAQPPPPKEKRPSRPPSHDKRQALPPLPSDPAPLALAESSSGNATTHFIGVSFAVCSTIPLVEFLPPLRSLIPVLLASRAAAVSGPTEARRLEHSAAEGTLIYLCLSLILPPNFVSKESRCFILLDQQVLSGSVVSASDSGGLLLRSISKKRESLSIETDFNLRDFQQLLAQLEPPSGPTAGMLVASGSGSSGLRMAADLSAAGTTKDWNQEFQVSSLVDSLYCVLLIFPLSLSLSLSPSVCS